MRCKYLFLALFLINHAIIQSTDTIFGSKGIIEKIADYNKATLQITRALNQNKLDYAEGWFKILNKKLKEIEINAQKDINELTPLRALLAKNGFYPDNDQAIYLTDLPRPDAKILLDNSIKSKIDNEIANFGKQIDDFKAKVKQKDDKKEPKKEEKKEEQKSEEEEEVNELTKLQEKVNELIEQNKFMQSPRMQEKIKTAEKKYENQIQRLERILERIDKNKLSKNNLFGILKDLEMAIEQQAFKNTNSSKLLVERISKLLPLGEEIDKILEDQIINLSDQKIIDDSIEYLRSSTKYLLKSEGKSLPHNFLNNFITLENRLNNLKDKLNAKKF